MDLIDVYSRRDAPLHLWQLLGERQEDESISHAGMPSWNSHKTFVDSHPYRAWSLVAVGGLIAGAVYATHRNEVGVQIYRACRGQGYARQGLEALMASMQPLDAIPGVRQGTWVANINPRNRVSIALFKSMGFNHVQNTYALRDS
jgi:L-amino acid N-acyltransferase YncA